MRVCGHSSFNVKEEKTFLIKNKINSKSLSISPEESQDFKKLNLSITKLTIFLNQMN